MLQKDLATKTISGYRTARASTVKANQVDKLLVALITKTQMCKQSLKERSLEEPLAKEQKTATADAPTSYQAQKNTQRLA